MRISDWSSDVCSSDLFTRLRDGHRQLHRPVAGAARLVQLIPGNVLAELHCGDAERDRSRALKAVAAVLGRAHVVGHALRQIERSEERRGGKEGVSTCRSRWAPYQ